MKITKCIKCGGMVSDQASTCPNCGAPPGKNTPAAALSAKRFIGVAFVALIAAASFYTYSERSHAVAPVTAPTTPPADIGPNFANLTGCKQIGRLAGAVVEMRDNGHPEKEAIQIAGKAYSDPAALLAATTMIHAIYTQPSAIALNAAKAEQIYANFCAVQHPEYAQAALDTPTLAKPDKPEQVLPSFSCAGKLSVSEKLICDDPELSALDAELGSIFARAKLATHDKKTFLEESAQRWKQREAECRDKECLVAWYASRKSELLASH